MIDLIRAELSATRPFRSYVDAMPEDDLRDDLGMDDLDIVSIAIGIEEALHIDLPDSVVTRWRTVGDIVQSVEMRSVA